MFLYSFRCKLIIRRTKRDTFVSGEMVWNEFFHAKHILVSLKSQKNIKRKKVSS